MPARRIPWRRASLAAGAMTAALACAAAAQESAGEGVDAPTPVAVLRGLDKVTARTRDFNAPLHEEVTFGSLTLIARYCRKRPPEETPETFVLLEIYERTTDGEGQDAEPERIFSGWMFASSPALNALEHPVFDVWPLDCVEAQAPALRSDGAGEGEEAAAPGDE